MFKILAIAVLAVQLTNAKLREDRNIEWKKDVFIRYAGSAANEVAQITTKTEHDVFLAENCLYQIAGDIKAAGYHLEIAIKGNTRNSPQGKQLYEISKQFQELEDWSQKAKTDSKNRLENLKQMVYKFTKLVGEVIEAVPTLKEATDNFKLSKDYCMHTIHVSIISMKKLTRRLETKRTPDAELLDYMNKILAQDLSVIDKLQTEHDDEVMVHIVEFTYLLKDIVATLKEKIPKLKDTKAKSAAEETLTYLGTMIEEMEAYSKSEKSLQNMKDKTKQWMRGTYGSITKLFELIKDQPLHADLIRPILIDCLVVNYKTLFEEFAENK